jgi:hypothetical protein
MPPEILALIDHPLSLVAVLFVGALFGMTLEQIVSRQRREAWKARKKARGEWVERGHRGLRPAQTTRQANAEAESFLSGRSGVPDPADQLRTVMASQFKPKRLLNKGEEKVLAALEPIVAKLEPGWRVWTQVSLGEVLDADSVEAFNTINAKRVDFLLVDADQRPRLAIEYQGQGHHQGAAAARDAVKREALRRAGVGYGEVFAGDGPKELAQVVARVMAGAGVERTFGVRSTARS